MLEVTSPGLSANRVIVLTASGLCKRNGTCLRLRMTSVASSTTPGIDWNSCSTPSIFTAVTAAPSTELNSTRRKELPMVVPKPRSNGWA